MEVLHGRVRAEWIVRGVVAALVVGAVAFGGATLLSLGRPLVVGAVVGGVLALLGAGHALLLYRTWRFDLEDDALYLERGVFTRVETAVPYVRVQHVDTQRNPFDRGLGLARVVVYTAGSRGADVTIPGLTPERARELRNDLRSLAVESEPEDAV